jgi:hypothetical protein
MIRTPFSPPLELELTYSLPLAASGMSVRVWVPFGADRLHDRLRYRRAAAGWTLERLAP